jgi:hypothetical protein
MKCLLGVNFFRLFMHKRFWSLKTISHESFLIFISQLSNMKVNVYLKIFDSALTARKIFFYIVNFLYCTHCLFIYLFRLGAFGNLWRILFTFFVKKRKYCAWAKYYSLQLQAFRVTTLQNKPIVLSNLFASKRMYWCIGCNFHELWKHLWKVRVECEQTNWPIIGGEFREEPH